jgi:hypothetical protein
MAIGQYSGGIGAIAGAIVGGIVGYYTGYGAYQGAMIGASLGGMAGGVAGSVLWPEKVNPEFPPPPQPNENRTQISTYGTSIPIVYESSRLAGNIIYMSDVNNTVVRTSHRQDGVRYYEIVQTYTSTFAIAFCEGQVESISRIWLNGKVFADFRNPLSPNYPVGNSSLAYANWSTSVALSSIYFSIYYGSDTQISNSSISAIIGAAETPAYRGICYIVFIDFPIGEFSGIPTVEIEISPYTPGNLVTYDAATSRLYLHSGITNTITSTTDFSAYSPLLEHNAMTPDSDLIKINASTKTVYIFSGVTTTISSSFVASSVPYTPTGFTCHPSNGYYIIGADNGLGSYSRRTIHYVFDNTGAFVSSWQDDSVYGGTPLYSFLPDGRMIVQYYSSSYAPGPSYGSRFVVYSSYLGGATIARWGPQPHWDTTGYTSGGFLFGSRPVTEFLHMNYKTSYYKFILSDLIDDGTRFILPVGAYISQNISDPSGYAQGAQLTNGFEGY